MPIDQPTRQPHLLAVYAQEQAAITAGTISACFDSCACHGDIVCLRGPHDATSPHLGHDPDGQLVQWVHGDEHGPKLTAVEVAAQAAEMRREHTRALLATLDLDLLRELLAE